MQTPPLTSKTLWPYLALGAGLIWLMILLGGLTRLTGSGLSITEWSLLKGILPPLTQAHWEELFVLYQQTPEYQHVNSFMTLSEFKGIFWLEYIHRLLGRVLGLFLLVPLWITFRNRALSPQRARVAGVWLLVSFQGAVGWYMVKSGLIKDPHVSPYRLALHLFLATTSLSAMVWLIDTLRPFKLFQRPGIRPSQAGGLFALAFVTLIYGAIVAGMKAGLLYNTFPLMDGQWIPDEAFFHQPWIVNFFINDATVQWTHRVLACSLVAWVSVTLWRSYFAHQKNPPMGLVILHSLVWVQACLGVLTLVFQVPTLLALLHQTGGVLVCLTTALILKKSLDAR